MLGSAQLMHRRFRLSTTGGRRYVSFALAVQY